MDLPFFLLVLLIMCFGLIMMFSASYASAYYTMDNSAYYFIKQGLIALGGTVVMLVISRMNYQYLRILSLPMLAGSIVLLILVPIIGFNAGGATRWIKVGPVQLQPSEVAKFAVIVSFSSMISVFREKMKTFKYGILPFATVLVVIAALMLLQPHISGAILIVAVGGALMFVGGVHWGWFAGAIAVAVAAGYFVMTNMAHAIARIRIWQDPFSDPQGGGYQIIQSLYAVGSGGLFGLGLGKSRQKHLYLPEQHNDFIFAIVCEELGMVGACLVLFLFALLIIRGYWIAIRSRDRFGSLMVTGVITLLAVQTFLNVAVVTNLIPVTGISLPFFSYGGTSLLIQLAEMGVVLSVSRQIPAPRAG
ncbi:MAG: putative lipid II flippase FtsW [Clostridiales bacterium]|nr:putative lipid II flippase FtsW [Clostridiales bacterium]